MNIAIDVFTKIKPAKFDKAMTGHCSDITQPQMCEFTKLLPNYVPQSTTITPSPAASFQPAWHSKATEGFW